MISLGLVFLIVGLFLLTWFIKTKRQYSRWPPGPPIFPLVGSLLSFPITPYASKAFEKLAKKYGDVFHVKLGHLDAVVFNSYAAVREILVHDKAYGRKDDFIKGMLERNLRQNLGIIFANGESWKTHRPFTIRTLRTFGFGKSSSMNIVINLELDKFFQQLTSSMEKNPEDGIQVESLFSQTIIHILWRLVTGIDYKLGDPTIRETLEITSALMKSSNLAFDISTAFPVLWDMFPNWSGRNIQYRLIGELHQHMRKTIQEHKDSKAFKEDPQSYIDVFLAEIEKTKDDPNSNFNDDQLLVCLVDLFQAGGETSSKTLSFSMMYMILNPDIQEKVYNEICEEVGINGIITADMKSRLPYTHATLLECFRWSIVIPFPPPRKATEDFIFRGDLIKKETLLLVNLEAAHFDKNQWGDARNFRPERFLAEDGFVDGKIASYLVNFGDGKRNCLGASLAESSTFIYFASILRSFKLIKPDGHPNPNLEPEPGASYSPKPFNVKFIPRQT